jgi:hypothetical protein
LAKPGGKSYNGRPGDGKAVPGAGPFLNRLGNEEYSMSARFRIFTTLLNSALAAVALAESNTAVAQTYKALKYAPTASSGTWAILERDGANRQVPRYLSSLGGGETGTGLIASPPFQISVDTIAFTICGHDGPSGGQNKNFVALVDSRKGQTLQKTTAPGNDAMQERSWDVGKLRGREVRIEVHDGDSGPAFAWLGVGRIDAGDSLRVDFRNGLPDGWIAKAEPAKQRPEVLRDGIPFLRHPSEYSLVPLSGLREIPCGVAAQRLFFLGGTVASGRPLETCGSIELVYRSGPPESYPLIYGYTLDLAGKLLSKSKAMHLHESADAFQHYLVIAPRADVIDKIVFRPSPEHTAIPRITAVTCQTQAAGENLEPLPDGKLDAAEEAWIHSHTIAATSPDMEPIKAEIRRTHKLE